MSNAFELSVEARDTFGKGASRRLRRLQEKVPAIVYGSDKAPESVMLEARAVNKALSNEAFYSHILTLNHDGKKQKVVLKDVQRHPYKPIIMHMDFMRISDKHPITMHVPLHFLGELEGPGVKEGGIVTHHMVEVEVKCLPKDLPEYIEIDLANAPMDTVVHLSQVQLPKGVELTSVVHNATDDLPVVSIHKPKRVMAEEEEVAAAEASAEEAEEGKENNKEQE